MGGKVYRTDQLGNKVVKTDGNTSTINGNSIDVNGTINLNGSIKRVEFVKILNKVFGLTNKSGKVFNNIVNHWAIEIAVTNGGCQGISVTIFNPDAQITRKAVVKMIANYKKITDTHYNKINGYTDGNKVSSWAKNEVEAGYMN